MQVFGDFYFYRNGRVKAVSVTEDTYICLIPKKVESLKIGDYRH